MPSKLFKLHSKQKKGIFRIVELNSMQMDIIDAWGLTGGVQAVASLPYIKMVLRKDAESLAETLSYPYLSSPWH